MDQARLLAEIAAAQTQPDDVLYLERQGDDYRWRLLGPGEFQAGNVPQGQSELDAWIFYTGPWPTGHPDDLPAFLGELLAEMESMCGGVDRCRWPLDQPYPLRH